MVGRDIICHAINIFADASDSFSEAHAPHPPFLRRPRHQGPPIAPCQTNKFRYGCGAARNQQTEDGLEYQMYWI